MDGGEAVEGRGEGDDGRGREGGRYIIGALPPHTPNYILTAARAVHFGRAIVPSSVSLTPSLATLVQRASKSSSCSNASTDGWMDGW